jgi:hypothetical protein
MPEDANESTANGETVYSHLIKTCGEFWNPEYVNWSSPYQLFGKRKPNGPDINVWQERGVYILYKDHVPVYVGKGDKGPIGDRLWEHRKDWRKGARWDSFSWYGILGLNDDDKVAQRAETHQISTRELIAALEVLLIAVIDPRLNSRREWVKGVTWLYQSEKFRPKDMESRLDSIEKKLEQLIKGQGVT